MTTLYRQALSYADLNLSVANGAVYGIGVTVDGVRYNIECTNSTGGNLSTMNARNELVSALNAYVFPDTRFRLRAYPVGVNYYGVLIVIDYDAETVGSIVVSRSANNGTSALLVNSATLMHTALEAKLYTNLVIEYQAYVASHPDASGAPDLTAATAAVVAAAASLTDAAAGLQVGATALTEALQTPLSGSATSADPTVGVTLASLAGFFMGKASGDQPGERAQISTQADKPRTSDGVSF